MDNMRVSKSSTLLVSPKFGQRFTLQYFSLLTKGNLVNWDNSIWELDEGIEWTERSRDDVCLLPKPRDIIFPESRTFTNSIQFCNKLKGHMSVTDSPAKQAALAEEFMRVIEHDYKNAGWRGKLHLDVMR